MAPKVSAVAGTSMRDRRAQEATVTDSRRAWRLALAAGLVGLMLSVVWASVTVTGADAQLRSPAASDPRATFVNSNVVTCSGAGFPLTIQMGSPANTDAFDAYVSGTVAANAGTVQPGVGEEVNITIVGPGVVIDAVVVKGGQAHNIYSNPTFLPPTLVAPQHYISPFNGGGNVPTISHWFVCYHLTTPPQTGTLTVEKAVIAPDGIPVSPLPTSFSAVVNCDDGIPAHQNVTVTFNLGGGRAATTPQLTGLADGTSCTVVEQNSGSFPTGAVVTYVPTGADDPGVTIAGGVGVVIGIVNDFSGIGVQRATIEVTKTVVSVPDVEVPATFTAHVTCDDGTSTDVTLPGTGGPGAPVSVRAPALCHIEELADSVPPGWVVTYSVDGGPASTTAPIVGPIAGNATVAITITNDPTDATTTTTTTTVATTTTTAAGSTSSTTGASGAVVGAENLGTGSGSGSGDLPFTGLNTGVAIGVAVVSLTAGVALLGQARRRRMPQSD
jgi:hypothetical protein